MNRSNERGFLLMNQTKVVDAEGLGFQGMQDDGRILCDGVSLYVW